MSLLQNSNAISEGGYNIANSLRFQSASSQYLSRTPASSGDRTMFTWSSWVKVGTISTWKKIFSAWNANTDAGYFDFGINNNNTFTIQGWNTLWRLTTQVFRDPSAWYHIVVAVDTTQATAANRIKLYINGSEVTAFSTSNNPTQNYNFIMNANVAHYIGTDSGSGFVGTSNFDGYMAEVNFVGGQALTPSSFGETNTLTGQWVAKKYTGTYGTNGFYLPFSNGTSTTTLGYDSSGNSNNWTLNNFTRSAGVTDCWMYDVPSGNGSQAGGTQPNSNYCVLNKLSTTSTLADGNLKYSNGNSYCQGSIFPTSGLFYAEIVASGAFSSYGFAWGIASGNANLSTSTQPAASTPAGIWYVYSGGGLLSVNSDGSSTNQTNPFTIGATWQIAIDTTNGYCWLGQNNTWYSSTMTATGNPATGANPTFTMSSLSTRGGFSVICGNNTAGGTFTLNFGQRAFVYTPPTGFKALCTANLPASTIVKGNQYMDATTYSGQGTNLTLVNAGGFQPDIVWMKCRSNADDHALVDSVRGVTPALYPNSTTAEISAGYLTSFNSNGVTITTGFGTTNIAGRTYVAWQWDAGSSTVTNTNGTISSQVRANPTAGVSVVTYTGTGANATVGHGLGVAPKMIIVKNRSISSSWIVWNTILTSSQFLYLNTTDATQTISNYWNGLPTSTIFNVNGSYSSINGSGNNLVAYCFAEIAGFSKFGSYTGNASSDGNFLYFGFRPKYIMIKNITTNGFGGWVILDSSRNSFNVVNSGLAAESAGAEFTVAYGDFLSNGFKIRIVDNGVNASGQSYIYMAFAENPFANANAR